MNEILIRMVLDLLFQELGIPRDRQGAYLKFVSALIAAGEAYADITPDEDDDERIDRLRQAFSRLFPGT